MITVRRNNPPEDQTVTQRHPHFTLIVPRLSPTSETLVFTYIASPCRYVQIYWNGPHCVSQVANKTNNLHTHRNTSPQQFQTILPKTSTSPLYIFLRRCSHIRTQTTVTREFHCPSCQEKKRIVVVLKDDVHQRLQTRNKFSSLLLPRPLSTIYFESCPPPDVEWKRNSALILGVVSEFLSAHVIAYHGDRVHKNIGSPTTELLVNRVTQGRQLHVETWMHTQWSDQETAFWVSDNLCGSLSGVCLYTSQVPAKLSGFFVILQGIIVQGSCHTPGAPCVLPGFLTWMWKRANFVKFTVRNVDEGDDVNGVRIKK